MKRYLNLVLILLLAVSFTTCEKDDNLSGLILESKQPPSNLNYQDIANAREFTFLKTGLPAVDTDNLVPFFEIVSAKKEDGTVLDNSFLKDVSIQNPVIVEKDLQPANYYFKDGVEVTTYTAVDYTDSGVVTIQDENNFDIGVYFFTISVTTQEEDTTYKTVFDDVLKIGIGPELVTNLLYSPLAQNLVVGQDAKTTKPFLINGNTDVTFALNSDENKLDIDTQTGEISLKSNYTTIENDTIYPSVNVISNISGEISNFQGESFLFLVASNTPVNLPKQTKFFFYPSFEAENKTFGYSKEVITPGLVSLDNTWTQTGSSNLADIDDSLPEIDNKKALFTNVTVGGDSEPHESDLIINTQDLSQFRLGFDLQAVFFLQNRFVEYLEDGRTPTELDVFISTDYNGNNSTATWTKVNDDIFTRINSNTGNGFMGLPYPGDQKGTDPDGRKDSSRNADGRWIRCELDLNNYKEETQFTLKFKLSSNFTESIRGATGRAGRHLVSDVHFKATEQ